MDGCDRFAPTNDQLWKITSELRDAYKERSVKVVQAIYSKPPDAVQEFRMITNQFTAENGRSSGSVVNVITKSGTRKEELLIPREDLNRIWVLRKVLNPLSPVEQMEVVLERLGKTKTNAEFLASMQS